MKRYYEVVAKCGHVGKRYYYRGVFYVNAENGEEAARAVRYFPRVKHDHPDAILKVTRVTEDEYLAGKERVADEVYFRCESMQEQGRYWDEISANIYPEARYNEDEEERKPHVRRRQKDKPFNWRNYDWDDAA